MHLKPYPPVELMTEYNAKVESTTFNKVQGKPGGARDEHLQWCKDRALAYVDANDTQQAFSSMASDLTKHPETKADHASTIQLGMMQMMGGHLDSAKAMRDFIVGFN